MCMLYDFVLVCGFHLGIRMAVLAVGARLRFGLLGDWMLTMHGRWNS